MESNRVNVAHSKLRVVIDDALMLSGVLKYTLYENYKAKCSELQSEVLRINPRALPRMKSVDDLKRKLDKAIDSLTEVATTLEMRFIHDDHILSSQNKQFGLHQIFRAMRGMSEDQIFNLYVQATSEMTDHNFELTNRMSVVKFLEKVLDVARKSDHSAINMVSEYHKALTQIGADAIKVKEDGNVLIYDIAPEMDEVV